jgi:hypothetical protein
MRCVGCGEEAIEFCPHCGEYFCDDSECWSVRYKCCRGCADKAAYADYWDLKTMEALGK